jgi:hypothetical protein
MTRSGTHIYLKAGEEVTWEHLTPTMRKVLLSLPDDKTHTFVGRSRTIRALMEVGLVVGYRSMFNGTSTKLVYASITDEGLALRAGKSMKS